MYDVLIVGGSYAGMAAALQLARGRRHVLLLDTGQPRNRFASTSHGVLGQDGRAPAQIAGDAKAQLLKYPHVTWRDDAAIMAEKTGEYFTIHTKQGEILTARRLVLATGVSDELPKIPGYDEKARTPPPFKDEPGCAGPGLCSRCSTGDGRLSAISIKRTKTVQSGAGQG